MPVTAEDVSAPCWRAGWDEDNRPRPGHEACREPYDPSWGGCQCACHPKSPAYRGPYE